MTTFHCRMSNVVKFVRPSEAEPLVWTCSCGCSTHRFYTTGGIECASCGNIASISGGEWLRELPEPPSAPREDLPETKVISLNGSPRKALETMLNRIDPESLVALIAIQENGRVNTWGGIDTMARKEWLERRLDDALGLLTILAEE